MNRSQKSSNLPSSLKLQPINLKTISTIGRTSHKHKDSSMLKSLCDNSENITPHKDISCIIQREDVQELERKILNFDAKDDGSIPSKHLFQLRRNYDEISKQVVGKQFDITRLKGEIEVMKRTINVSRQSQCASKRNVDDLQKNVNSVKAKQVIEQMNTKTLEQMIDRMRKDEVVHKTRITILDKKIKSLESGIKDSQTKSLIMGEHQSANLVVIEQVKQQYKQTAKQRMINYELYQGLIMKKQGIEMQQQERMKITQDIQAMASNDINDVNFAKYTKLMGVQKFLRKMLRCKILNLEQKYYDTKKSYNTIQVKTAINDPRQLSKTYFQMQSKYKQYLEQIRQLQNQEKQLNDEKEELQKKWKSLQSYEYSEDDENSSDQAKNEQFIRNRQNMDEKWLKIHLIQIRINNFIMNSLKKLNICRSLVSGVIKQQKQQQIYSQQNTVNEFCQRLLELSKEIQDKHQQNPHFQSLKVLQAVTMRDFLQIDQQKEQRQQIIKSKQ